MGFVSNQWLNRGEGFRDRGYYPVSVTIEVGSATGSWSKEHRVAVEITATRHNDQYQTLLLSKADAEKCAATILAACGNKVRERLARQVLRRASATNFVAAMTSALKSRFRSVPKK